MHLQLLSHVHLSSDLGGEVLLLLLDALAGLEANGGDELHGTAQLLGGVGNVVLHGALEQVAADELHLQQAVLLVELVHLAHDDLLLDLGGLGGHLGIAVHQSQGDLLLLGQDVLGDLGLIPEAGIQSGDLHGDVLADLGGIHALHGQVHQNADLAAGMDIAHAGVLGEADEAADLQVLADGHDLLGHGLGHGQLGAGILAVHQGVHIGGVVIQNGLGDILDEIDEQRGLGSEVGLGIDLDDDADAVLDGIFCAGGDAKFDMQGNIGAMWCFSVPLGFLAAFWLKLPVMVVYCIVNLDEIVKLPAVYHHYKKYIWVRNITRDVED